MEMDGILGLLLLAICIPKSQGLTIDLLRSDIFEPPSCLRYRGGDCTWRISGVLGGVTIVVTDPHIELEGLDTGVEITCVVNGTVLLQADIISHAAVPPPHNVTLDTVNKRLQWEHPFLPQLPPLFKLVHGFTITFQVYGKKDGVHMPSLSVPVSNSIEFDSDLDYCAEHEFVVEAVTNISHEDGRQNSSAVSGYFIGVPSFRNLSAIAEHRGQYLHINVTFVLEEEDCPGTHPTFFIVTLEGLGEHRLDINSTHIEDGGGIFLISFAGPLPNTCHLEGTIFGGNDAGNGSENEIQHFRDPDCSSVMTPSGTISTAMATPSLTPLLKSSDKSSQNFVIGLIVGLLFLMGITSLGIALLFILFKKKRGSILPPKAEPNEYHSPGHIQSERPSGNETNIEFGQPTAVDHISIAMSDHKMVQEQFPSPQYASTGPPTDTAHESSQSEEKYQHHVTYTKVKSIAHELVPSYDTSTTGYAILDHQKTQEERKSVSDGQYSAECVSSVPTHERSLTTSQSHQEGSSKTMPNVDRKGLSLANLLVSLKKLGPKWYQLGTQLKLSKTLLDKTQTSIETDSQCLREILTNWLSYHESSLEKLNDALAEMNEQPLHYDASSRESAV